MPPPHFWAHSPGHWLICLVHALGLQFHQLTGDKVPLKCGVFAVPSGGGVLGEGVPAVSPFVLLPRLLALPPIPLWASSRLTSLAASRTLSHGGRLLPLGGEVIPESRVLLAGRWLLRFDGQWAGGTWERLRGVAFTISHRKQNRNQS